MNELTVIAETMSSKQTMDLLNEGKPEANHMRHGNIKRSVEHSSLREMLGVRQRTEGGKIQPISRRRK